MYKNFKNILVLIGFVLTLQSLFAQRQTYNFNSDWQFKTGEIEGAEAATFDTQGWTQVTLPHAYNQEEAFLKAIDEHSTGIVWYRKNFILPEAAKGQKIFLEFEGIRQGGTIYVNGKQVGLHENGVMAFGLDVSDIVVFDGKPNSIALRIDNDWHYRQRSTNATYRWNNINFNANYGGIPKNVFLHVTDKLYQTLPLYSNLKTTGVYVYATDFDIPQAAATIHVESEVKNEYDTPKTFQYSVAVFDLDNKKVAEFSGDETKLAPGEHTMVSAAQRLGDLNFWSWGYGYLYTVKSKLKVEGNVIDEVSTKTGFRKTEFKEGKVYLNDRVLQMKGYAQRTSNEWPAIGMSVPAWLSDFSNRMIVEGNGNLVRWMHVTPWKQDVESCDRVGLIQAMPAGDAEKDSQGDHWKQRTNLMRDAIIYNRNNPSIVFYESGNDAISEPHMAEMKSLRDTYDPYGGRAIGSREMLDSREAEYGGEMLYINKSARIPMWATEYSRDEGMRKYWDEFSPPFHKEGDGPLYKGEPATSYNHNQDRQAIEDVIRWHDYYEARPGTGHRVSSGGVNIIFSDSNTHYRGEQNYRTSGEVDPMRIPKDGFFAHQVMWNGWVDTEEHGTHILGHWNYKPGTQKDFYVVSTGEKVELFINGTSQGFGKKAYSFLFTFEDLRFEPGNVKAVSYDAEGRILSTAEKTTAGTPHSIRLKRLEAQLPFKADGADVALFEVEVVDKEGQRCPLDNSKIEFELDGPAIWLGGIADGPDNYIESKVLPVENGVNRVMIQSTTQAGNIKIKAKASGIKNASIKLDSEAFETQNGLASVLPGADLPSYLDRGPTPKTPSFSWKRKPVFIRSAQTANEEDEPYLSYDDNELTEWRNDGQEKTGWITYTLAKEAEINECVIKLTGWRRKKYPLRILAGDEVLFEGESWQSLGYITIPLKTVKTDEVTVQLAGAQKEEDGFNDIVEVDPNKELDLFKDDKAAAAKGQLRIVEIEFYEKL